MSTKDISEQIKNLYGIEISPDLVSKISERVMPQVTEWQARPLEAVYPFVFMDAIGAVYPNAGIQRCIIHQLRASTRSAQNVVFSVEQHRKENGPRDTVTGTWY